MNLARADTYINVYLPREDGVDLRKWARPSSPVFHKEEVYKFSDEIIKDRKLFLGKKQMSLYEIYYKDKDSGENSAEGTGPSSEGEHEGEDRSHETDRWNQTVPNNFVLPRMTKVSISLDQKIRRSHGRYFGRFNESSNCSSMYKTHSSRNKYNPNQSLERQVTSYDFIRSANRRKLTSDYVKSATARNEKISKLFKKVQSAPSETSKVRTLGLPPISRSNTALASLVPDVNQEVTRLTSAIYRAQPLRSSSKHHTIWRQTTNVLVPSSESLTMLDDRSRHSHVASSRSRLHTTGDIYV